MICPECESENVGLYAETYTKVWKCMDCGYKTQCYKDDETDDGKPSDIKGDMGNELMQKHLCPDCKENKPTIKSNMTGNILRCTSCEDIKREELGLPLRREGCPMVSSSLKFTPYKLKHGPLKELAGTEPSLNLDEWSVDVESRSHEDRLMRKMGTHIGEHGENCLGFEIGKTKPVHPEDGGSIIKE